MKSRGALLIPVAIVAIFLAIIMPSGAAQKLVPQDGGQTGGLLSYCCNPLSWSAPERLPAPATPGDAFDPSLAVDMSSGVVHVTWEEEGIIYYAFRDDQGWHLDETLVAFGDSPAIALDSLGQPHIAYADISLTNDQMQVFHCMHTGSSWTLPHIVSGTTGPSTSPDIFLVIEDNLHVVWSSKINGNNTLYHAQSNDNGLTWYSVLPIPGAAGFAPVLAVGPSHDVWVAWQTETSASPDMTSDICVARWDGSEWSPIENLSQSTGDDSVSPSIVCTQQNLLYVAWEEQRTDGVSLVYVASGVLGDWTAPLALSHGMGFLPRIAHDALGAVYVAWDAGLAVAMTWRPAQGPWQPIEEIAQATGGLSDIALARESGNRISAVWSAHTADAGRRLFYSQHRVDTIATDTPTPVDTVPPVPSGTPSPTTTVLPTLTTPATPTATGSAPAPSATLEQPESIAMPLILKTTTSAQSIGSFGQTATLKGSLSTTSLEDLGAIMPAWSAVRNISASGFKSSEPCVAVSGSQIIVVWVEEDLWGYSELCYSVYSAGLWSAPVCFFSGEEPALAASSNGTVHLAYANEFAGKYDIFYTYWSGSSWALPVNISQTSGTSSQPAIATKADGTPLIVWSDTTEGSNRIYHAWRTGALWNTYIIPSSSQGSTPSITVGQNDVVWVAWQAIDIGNYYEIYAIWGDGVTWNGFSIDVSGSGSVDSISPRLAPKGLQAEGMVWQEGSGGTADVYVATNTEYYPWWSVPENLSQTVSRSEMPALATDDSEGTFVAWDEGDSLLLREQKAAETRWQDSATVVQNAGDPDDVQLALGSDRTHFIWTQENQAGVSDVYYRSLTWDTLYSLSLPLVLSF